MGYAPGWQVRCRICGLTLEAGMSGPIVRLAAIGSSYMLGRCSCCRRVRLLVIERRRDPNKNVLPPIGFAPGWRVRCSTCEAEIDAERLGVIVVPGQQPMEISGPCRQCGTKRRLLIEPVAARPAAPAAL
jgi:hypothetical protein